MPRRATYILALSCSMFLLWTVSGFGQETPAVGVPQQVADLITQLDADRFDMRMKARKELIRMGAAAIKPLETVVIENTDNRELQTLGLDVLQSLALQQDPELERASIEALLRIESAASVKPTQETARRILATHAAESARIALAELKALGIMAETGGYATAIGPQQDEVMSIVVDSRWRGRAEDLARLKQLSKLKFIRLKGPQITDEYLRQIANVPTLERIAIRNSKITPKGLAELIRLPFLDSLEVRDTNLESDGLLESVKNMKVTQLRLIGIGLAPDEAKKLIAALPATKVKLHFGAFLGVGPRLPAVKGVCELEHVAPGSAAELAGLQEMDVITRFEDTPVDSFETLRDLIGVRSPGDKVKIEIKRAGKSMTLEVKLGELPELPN